MRTALSLLLLSALGCARGESPDTPGTDSAATDLAADDSAVRCFESPQSILGRHIASSDPASRSAPATGSGWVKLVGPAAADSGEARLVDGDGSALGAAWRRAAGDTVLVTGFDDFLRVELRMTLAGGAASGSAVATSDAALERDSTGILRDMRREWSIAARRAPCDSMPIPAQPHLR